jgi:hypothetical protein
MQKTTRKPLLWVLADFMGSLLLAAGAINLFLPENTFMPVPVRDWPGIPLLLVGALITILSMFMFIRRIRQIQNR